MVHPNDIQGSLVFTNDRGEVVFVNRHFLRMMHYGPEIEVIGEPMDAVMQLGDGIIAEMASHVKSGQEKSEILLHLYVNGDEPHYVLCAGEGAYDGNGTYIGLNFSFRQISDPSRLTSIPQIRIDPGGRASDDSSPEYVAATAAGRYVTHEVEALRVFLARIMGIGMGRRMDDAIQKAISRYNWAATLYDSQLQFDSDRATPETYLGVLSAAIDFAVDIAGERWISRELEASEAGLNSVDIAEADDVGLRDFLHRQ